MEPNEPRGVDPVIAGQGRRQGDDRGCGNRRGLPEAALPVSGGETFWTQGRSRLLRGGNALNATVTLAQGPHGGVFLPAGEGNVRRANLGGNPPATGAGARA